MKEVSLKILFSVSSHSRFVLGTPLRLINFCVACSLTRTDSTSATTLCVSDSSNQSLSLSRLSTDGFCFLFPHHSVHPIRFRLLRFPCCLCTASTLFTSCIDCFTLPLHSASTLSWYIPNTNSNALRWFLPPRFVRIVHLLRNSFTFLGSLRSLPKLELSNKNSLLLVFISYSILCIKFLVDDSLFSVHQCQRSALLTICKC